MLGPFTTQLVMIHIIWMHLKHVVHPSFEQMRGGNVAAPAKKHKNMGQRLMLHG